MKPVDIEQSESKITAVTGAEPDQMANDSSFDLRDESSNEDDSDSEQELKRQEPSFFQRHNTEPVPFAGPDKQQLDGSDSDFSFKSEQSDDSDSENEDAANVKENNNDDAALFDYQNTDLNKLSDEELRAHKEAMDIGYK